MFNIKKEETESKTFRMPKDLLERLEKLADGRKISLSSLVIQCCEYALENLNPENIVDRKVENTVGNKVKNIVNNKEGQ